MIFKTISSEKVRSIRDSGVFHAGWYLEQFKDVMLSGMDAFNHYIILGIYLGRKPNAKFDLLEYKRQVGIEDSLEALLDFIGKGMPSEFLSEQQIDTISGDSRYDDISIGYIDSPREGDLLGHDYIEVSGWCYLRGDEMKNGNVSIEGSSYPAELSVGYPRADVKKVFPHLKHHRVAFEGSIFPELHGKSSILKVTVQSVNGFTHTMTCDIRKSLDVKHRPIRMELRGSITHQILNGSAILNHEKK
jgi:hypothetical protein